MNDKQEKSYFTIGLIVVGIVFALIIIGLQTQLSKATDANVLPAKNTSVVSENNGIQYIDLTAKGGYSPKLIQAKANIETVLRIKTSNTFDCSSAISIPSLNYRNNLPPTGTTEVKIPPQSQNAVINGTCSMGMYGFSIKFI